MGREEEEEEEWTEDEIMDILFIVLFAMMDTSYIAIAVFYRGSCPKGHMIPVGNICSGIFNICRDVVVWYEPEWSEFCTNCWNVVTKMVEGMWLVAGVYWTYEIFPPDYDNEESPEYCNRLFYIFSLVTITFSSVTYVSIFVFSACSWCWHRKRQDGPNVRAQEQKLNLGGQQSSTHLRALILDKAPAGKKGHAMGKEKQP